MNAPHGRSIAPVYSVSEGSFMPGKSRILAAPYLCLVPAMLLHYDIRVSGKVQGVFFRASARAEADRLGLQGFVRNDGDGSVYGEAEGERERLDGFLQGCRQGPPHAHVDPVKAAIGDAKGYRGFHVR